MFPISLGIFSIVFYSLTAVVTSALTLGLGDAAWIFISLFYLVRIANASLLIAAHKASSPAANLYAAAGILDSAGLALLFLTAIAFLGFVHRNGSYDDKATLRRVFYTAPNTPASSILAFLIITAFVLTTASSVIADDSQTRLNDRWQSLGQAGAILFTVIYGLLIIDHIVSAMIYRLKPTLGTSRGRELLIFSTFPLPFLAVRVVYYLLSTYAHTHPSLAQYNVITGDWRLFLGMSMLMEAIIVILYNLAILPVYLFYGSGM